MNIYTTAVYMERRESNNTVTTSLGAGYELADTEDNAKLLAECTARTKYPHYDVYTVTVREISLGYILYNLRAEIGVYLSSQVWKDIINGEK
jgi:hypothetical protein